MNCKYKRLGEVATYINGYAFKPSDWEEDGMPIIRIQNLTDQGAYAHRCKRNDIPEKYRVKSGDVLVSWSATLGVYEWKGEDAWLNQHIFKVVFDRESIDKTYFEYVVESSISEMAKHTNGATMKHIRKGDFDNILIPYPPLSEQQRIVSILDRAFEKIDALKANVEENLLNVQILLQQSLQKEFQMKDGWKEKKLGELGTFKNGMNFAHNESGVDLHLLGVGDFKDYFSIEDTSELQILSLNEQPTEDYLLQNEDVVFVRSNGNKQLVGRSVVVYPNGIPTTFSGFCIRFRKSTEDLNTRYLVSFLKHPETRKKLVGNGANISNLNQKVLNDLNVPIPPLLEQVVIANKICKISGICKEMEQKYQKIVAECEALKQSILRNAFNGEL